MRTSVLGWVAGISLLLAAPVLAQSQNPTLPENAAEKLTDHVYILHGFPNIAIVVGNTATLVVDTGLGAKNGEVVARTAAKLKGSGKLYLTTTHFHPEHAAGEGGFPAGTTLIRARAQQEELEHDNGTMLARFRQNFPGLIDSFAFRKPDVLFDKQYDLDLGGVHARLIYAGPAHTRGDEEVFVEPDSVLVTGDVIQNKTGPFFTAAGIGPRDWLRAVEALATLHPKMVLPDHSPPGGEALVAEEAGFLRTLDDRAHVLKAGGRSVEAAAQTINGEMKAKYPNWQLRDLTDAVARAYAE